MNAAEQGEVGPLAGSQARTANMGVLGGSTGVSPRKQEWVDPDRMPVPTLGAAAVKAGMTNSMNPMSI